jgi:hypothetical protein
LDVEQQNWLKWVLTRKGMITLTVASVVLLSVAIAGGWYFLSRGGSGSTQDLDSPPTASLSELAKEYPELKNILQDEKLDSVYKEFMLVYQRRRRSGMKLAQTNMLNANGVCLTWS